MKETKIFTKRFAASLKVPSHVNSFTCQGSNVNTPLIPQNFTFAFRGLAKTQLRKLWLATKAGKTFTTLSSPAWFELSDLSLICIQQTTHENAAIPVDKIEEHGVAVRAQGKLVMKKTGVQGVVESVRDFLARVEYLEST